jgi:hypothetical protein
MTNWDARYLGDQIKRGTPVEFIDAKDKKQAKDKHKSANVSAR